MQAKQNTFSKDNMKSIKRIQI